MNTISSPPLDHVRTILLAASALLAFSFSARAGDPPEGTIQASSTDPVTWVGSATGGASAGEASCEDTVNCDVFTLTVAGDPADYAGKLVTLEFEWDLPADDYDFYIHKGSLDGPVVTTGGNDGAPATSDGAAIDPSSSGTGVYVIHAVYFSVTPLVDQYRGTAKIATKSGADRRNANYLNEGIAFSPNVALKAPVTGRDGEPSNRTDFKGNSYVGGIRGFPAGVDLWYFDLNPTDARFDPNMRVPIYRGQPDAFSPSSEADLGGDGGGDIDLAVGFSIPNGQKDPTLAFSSLIAANISAGNSVDRAVTYNRNPAGNVTGGVPGDDRQWQEFLGGTSVYLYYRTLAPAVTMIQRSEDGGFSYGPAATAGTLGQVGPIDVHQKTGTVYVPGSGGMLGVGTPSTPGEPPTSADYKVRTAASDPNGVAHLFFITKVADDGRKDGTLYACYSNDADIFLRSSTDKGVTWNKPVRVNPPSGPFATKVNVFPWMETGPKPGSVGIVWYGTTNGANNDKAEWKVYFAQSLDADAATPTFRIADVTEPGHFIHASNISEGGLTGTANRNLIDYFQVSFDPQGAAVIAYTDDHNDFDGHTYVARQISGPSVNGGTIPAPAEGSGLSLPAGTSTVMEEDTFPPRQPGRNGEQVTDFPLDVQNGLLTRVRAEDPADIVSVRYDTSGSGASLAIAAGIEISGLIAVPPATTYLATFAVNAPNSVLSETGTYTYGLSDHADQFFIQADTDGSGGATYSYGTVKRLSTGLLEYTPVGDADTGSVNTDDGFISIQVKISKLNAALKKGRPRIKNGTVVTGLRARTITAGNPGTTRLKNDLTRGGTQLIVHDSAFPFPAAAPSPSPLPPRAVAPGATPAPTPPEKEFANIATRVAVQSGENAGVAGFIIRTSESKRLIIRGLGPSLGNNEAALAGTLRDPVLVVQDADGNEVASNGNWRESQEAEITASGLAPSNNLEAAVIVNLAGGGYTATLRGSGQNQNGIGLIEIYDIDADSFADLGNISTRGQVGLGDKALIGGIIVRDDSSKNRSQDIVLRGIGPSLAGAISDPLADPVLELVDSQGNTLATNDDFRATDLKGTILKPENPKESAIRRTLAPAAYTFILRGKGDGTGIGLVEAYNLGNQE